MFLLTPSMGHHHKLRENKTCENCGHFVEKRFCPECGQENIETRQRFHYLFMHFFEDFVHYDGRFWKTIQHLLFHPAKLTKEYLAGKRNRYVPPVTLYIFISFVTFFLPSILPDSDSKGEKTEPAKVSAENAEKTDNNQDKTVVINGKTIKLDHEKLKERIVHDFPKTIFLYMPVFAFWLWLFHSKKKWYYFDHGIYTLHYFSFILLTLLLFTLFRKLLFLFHIAFNWLGVIITLVMFGYFVYYFFHSHRLIYQERKAVSRLKCSALFFINSFCIIAFLVFYLMIETYISSPVFFKEIINATKVHF
jgi:ribosomal protein L37E